MAGRRRRRRARPFIRYHTFDESSIDVTVILRMREFTDQHLLKHEFMKQLHESFEREHIVIPFPIHTIDWPDSRAQFGRRLRK